MRESLKTDTLEQSIEVLAGRSMLNLEETLSSSLQHLTFLMSAHDREVR